MKERTCLGDADIFVLETSKVWYSSDLIKGSWPSAFKDAASKMTCLSKRCSLLWPVRDARSEQLNW
jgi:hypothetical protein